MNILGGTTRTWAFLPVMIVAVTGLLSDFSYAQPDNVVLVDVDNAPICGDGASWSTAFAHLQDAIEVASADQLLTEIWVAEGTYFPDDTCADPDSGETDVSFMMETELAIYGGFDGTETQLGDRTGLLTTLSGDLTGNDTPTTFVPPNSWHVLTFVGASIVLNPTAIVDGFTITAGNAQGPGQPISVENAGGGVLLLKDSVPDVQAAVPGPLFKNCRFIGNRANAFGGAIAGRNIGVTVENCYFENNEALSIIPSPLLPMKGGGAVSLNGPIAIVLSNFFQNTSEACGGALDFNTGHTVKIVNCKFWENEAMDQGGAVDVTSDTGYIVNCLFAGNTSFGLDEQNGGGVRGSLDVINCTFIDNRAEDDLNETELQQGLPADAAGGGMWVASDTAVIN